MMPATATELGLMTGAPPSAAQRVTLANWLDAPFNRWSFQHAGELVPSAVVSRGDGPVLPLEAAPEKLGPLLLADVTGRPTLDDFLVETYTDGFLVLQRGRILYERYLNGMLPASIHLVHSISKSLCSAATGNLVALGVIDVADQVSTHVPELWGTGFGDATIADLLDMTAAVVFEEEYENADAHVQMQDRVAGWRPRHPQDPLDGYAFLASLEQAGEHGRTFQYCSASTDVLAWTLERASGRRYPALLAAALWSRIGAEYEAAITVDTAGFAFANGGVSVTLRDLARFGHLMLNEGGVNGFRAVPRDWARRHRRGDPLLVRGSDFAAAYPDGSYSSNWWCTGDELGAFFATGIYGQFLWIVPAASLVIAKLSSLPRPLDLDIVREHHRAFASVAKALA